MANKTFKLPNGDGVVVIHRGTNNVPQTENIFFQQKGLEERMFEKALEIFQRGSGQDAWDFIHSIQTATGQPVAEAAGTFLCNGQKIERPEKSPLFKPRVAQSPAAGQIEALDCEVHIGGFQQNYTGGSSAPVVLKPGQKAFCSVKSNGNAHCFATIKVAIR